MLQIEKLTYRYDVLLRTVLDFLTHNSHKRSDLVTARIGSKNDVRSERGADVEYNDYMLCASGVP